MQREHISPAVLHGGRTCQRFRLESGVLERADARFVAQCHTDLGFELDSQVPGIGLGLGHIEVVDRDRVRHVARAGDDQLAVGRTWLLTIGQRHSLSLQIGHPHVCLARALCLAQGFAVDLDNAPTVHVQYRVPAEAARELIGVAAFAAGKVVITRAAVQGVVALAPENQVIAPAGVEDVGTVGTDGHVLQAIAHRLVTQRTLGRHGETLRGVRCRNHGGAVRTSPPGRIDGLRQDALGKLGAVGEPSSWRLHIAHQKGHASGFCLEQRLERRAVVPVRRGLRADGGVVVAQHSPQHPFLKQRPETCGGDPDLVQVLAHHVQHLVGRHRQRVVRAALGYAELVTQDVLSRSRIVEVSALGPEQNFVGKQAKERLVPLGRQIEALVRRTVPALQHQRQQGL
ncbi:hypothetical protein ACAN107058_19070 [Paracidovorax anthurii]